VKLVLLELNELSPELMAELIQAGELPNFRRLREESTVYSTDAGENPPALEPWIQWITVHTGVTFSEHRVFRLGDAEEKLRYPGIAKIISDAGVSVGIFGSMNAGYRTLRGYVIPDPWNKGGRPHPPSLSSYYDFVARRVQESSRDDDASLLLEVRFATTLLRAHLSGSALWQTIRQLVAERIDTGIRWRRACLLDLYQYDVFRWLNARHDVKFSTFFSNSVAHFQHYYWRNMRPDQFCIGPTSPRF
jgi:hypothetical protein